ncbi:MAG: ribonuclease HIII, partial [Candidatus Cloacimonetes bacterium]|nr:ribonuclease HIII [Candidatus Cloacimonadota bacterium]
MQNNSSGYLDYKADILTRLNSIGLQLEDSKEINYGEQLRFKSSAIELKITLYYNKKDQFKFVINKVTPEKQKDLVLNSLLVNDFANSQSPSVINENSIETTTFDLLAGSDESGKGDYFGPLVAVCFVCNKHDALILQKYGVKDSKLLTDEKITILGEKIFLDFKGKYQYLILMPEKYNELYPKFSTKKPGLNEMLAWMHSKTIGDLYGRHSFQKVIIDKFANEKLISFYVKKTCEADLEIVTKAESNIPVAVASILARYLYVKKMDELSEKYHIKLLKGASLQVKALR